MQCKLTVFYDSQFWVGVFEREEDGRLQATRVVFGPEPREQEIYEFVLSNYYGLQFGKALDVDREVSRRINPKRLQRMVHEEMQGTGVGTKAQQAMKLAQEATKTVRKKESREERRAEEQRKFDLRQEKKKSRHRGH